MIWAGLAIAVVFYLLGYAHGNYKGYEAGMHVSHEVASDAAYDMYEALMREARK